MKKIKVLVFPCGTEIGLEINRSLIGSSLIEMIGASSVNDHGAFVYKNYIDNLPFIDDDNCIVELNKIIDQYQIDFLIPAHDSAVLKFGKYRDIINCKVVTSDSYTCEICRSKIKTYQLLKGIVDTPIVYEDKPSYYPVFAKPDVGEGSRGSHFIANEKDYDFYVRLSPIDMVVTEYLPGKEYTIDCFTKSNGELIFCQGRIRERISNGISVRTRPVSDSRFLDLALKISKKLKFSGMWFFQVKEGKNNVLTLLEIAPRIAGTMGMYRVKGINFVQLSLFDLLGNDVKIIDNKFNLISDRALYSCYKTDLKYDYVYVDYDDTLVNNDLVNSFVIKFLYQSLNQGKKFI